MRSFLRSIKIQFYRARYWAFGVHPTTRLSKNSIISRDLQMGPYGYIGPGAEVPSGVQIGKYVMIGPSLFITGNDHIFEKVGVATIFSGRPPQERCIIEDDVWIGGRVTIMTGLTIGRGAVVAGCAVVTKDVAPYSVVAGVPARVIRERFSAADQKIHDAYLARAAQKGDFCEPI